MTFLAVLLAALGSCGYAFGARMQHRAVRDTIADQRLSLRGHTRLFRHSHWLLGLLALGGGALSHAIALGFAPLSVVQPVGVIALPITVLLTAREQQRNLRNLHPNLIVAVLAVTGGVAAFVLLAAGSAQATEVGPHQQFVATEIIALAVAALGVGAMLSRSKIRCVLFAAGCAVAYGYVSLLVRGVAMKLGGSWLDDINLLPLLGIVTAMVVGAWLLQHAYASGPPDLVVACLTVIDPLVAVGLGIGLLGEADQVSGATAAGEILCAVVACAGVFGLARFHHGIETPDLPAAVSTTNRTGRTSTDRPDGSTT